MSWSLTLVGAVCCKSGWSMQCCCTYQPLQPSGGSPWLHMSCLSSLSHPRNRHASRPPACVYPPQTLHSSHSRLPCTHRDQGTSRAAVHPAAAAAPVAPALQSQWSPCHPPSNSLPCSCAHPHTCTHFPVAQSHRQHPHQTCPALHLQLPHPHALQPAPDHPSLLSRQTAHCRATLLPAAHNHNPRHQAYNQPAYLAVQVATYTAWHSEQDLTRGSQHACWHAHHQAASALQCMAPAAVHLPRGRHLGS
jgi:hypothetical protein